MIRTIIFFLFITILIAGCITPPEEPLPAETATLQLSSSPSGADVFLDNESQGTTPLVVINVKPGNHTIEYRMKGYRSWQDTMIIPSGSSNFFTTLVAEPVAQKTTATPAPVTTSPARITAKAGKNPMIIGEKITFSGTATSTKSVSLTLFGPGTYTNGVLLDKVTPNSAGLWSFSWNPGTKMQSGGYTLIVQNAEKTASTEVPFTAIGNGEVTVSLYSYALGRGDTASLYGRCSTGAPNVKITLFGPGRYVAGITLATVSISSEETWNYRFPVDKTMPTGTYTVSVSDVPKTASGTSQFTIGYT